MKELNLGNSIFKGLNDHQGLMICGYEWGWSNEDDKSNSDQAIDFSIDCTFSNKSRRYGISAKKWRYDNTIKKWFSLWGHPLNEEDLGTNFDKSIVQTNWANTANHNVSNYSRFLEPNAVNNFINHIEQLRPKVIFFMGRNLIDYLRHPEVLNQFNSIVGKELEPLKMIQKHEYAGTKLKIFFQKFENCQIICLPHPSGSRGLSDEYISLYKNEIDQILKDFKLFKKL